MIDLYDCGKLNEHHQPQHNITFMHVFIPYNA